MPARTQLAQAGGGMFVYQNSGDVSLEGASFSECTAAYVRLPRPHTLAPKGHSGLPALSRSLTPSPLLPARPNSRSPEEV